MSWDDKSWMSSGFYVRHKYRRRRGRTPVCQRCGVLRRHASSGWEYKIPVLGGGGWRSDNPPCVKKEK